LGADVANAQKVLAEQLWNVTTKDKFRAYCSLDADAIKQYKQLLKAKS
jgi:flagellum-specific peptidoglycan hydrolase FlgJ